MHISNTLSTSLQIEEKIGIFTPFVGERQNCPNPVGMAWIVKIGNLTIRPIGKLHNCYTWRNAKKLHEIVAWTQPNLLTSWLIEFLHSHWSKTLDMQPKYMTPWMVKKGQGTTPELAKYMLAEMYEFFGNKCLATTVDFLNNWCFTLVTFRLNRWL